MTTIADNLAVVKDRIHTACERAGRKPDEITIVAVTKYVGPDEARALFDAGIRHFGENRIGGAIPKIAECNFPDATWHMIGNVQRRKVKDIIQHFHRIDAIDRVELAGEVQKRAAAADMVVPVLIEVNVSGEESKHGFQPAELPQAIDTIAGMSNVAVEGLMTMAPFHEDPELARPHFQKLRQLTDRARLPVCSMGMSNDYEIAIAEGATEVRIGSALFEGLN